MLERLAGTVLDKVLSKYFEPVDEGQKVASVGIWSGYLSLHNLRLKVDTVNDILKSAGHPFRLVQGSIRHVKITVPWTQWSTLLMSSSSTSKSRASASSGSYSSSATAIVVVDGIHILLESTPYEFDDKLLREAKIRKRRAALQQASDDMMASANVDFSTSDDSTWLKRMIRRVLQEGLFPVILDRLEIHLRDLHVRMEDIFRSNPETPFAVGIVLESLHIQHDQQQEVSTSNSTIISKTAQLNHLGVYWNALHPDADGSSRSDGNGGAENPSLLKPSSVPCENRILRDGSFDDILQALDQSIARRSTALQKHQSAPVHTYVLLPADVNVQLHLSKNPSSVAQPAVTAVCRVDPHFALRDFQCLHAMMLAHHWKEHKYHRNQEYRRFRPTCTVAENPSAWWAYAVKTVMRFQLDQRRFSYSVERARQRLQERKLYCDLYERVLVRNAGSLTDAETEQLQNLEDGIEGELSIPDILLFRIMVRKRLGKVSNGASNGTSRRGWLGGAVQTLVADDVEAKKAYDRVLEYWSAWSIENQQQQQDEQNVTNLQSCVSVQFTLQLQTGQLSFFAPLPATADQSPLLRLQERFLELRYGELSVSVALMGDYETVVTDVSLGDMEVLEVRSNREEFKVVSQPPDESTEGEALLRPPLVGMRLTKHSPSSNDFDKVVQCRVLSMRIDMDPQAEWPSRLRRSIGQSIPQLRRVENFWHELSLANINSWASRRLGLLAKVDSAASENKKTDLDIDICCPVIRVMDGHGAFVQLDLGRARLRTQKLAGVADAKLVRSSYLELEPAKASTQLPNGDSDKTEQRHRGNSMASNGGDSMTTPFKSGDQSVFGSIRSGSGSLRLDPVSRMLSESFRTASYSRSAKDADSMNAFFYNTYELRYEMGCITVVEAERSSSVLVPSAVAMGATLHKSILPADHTLFRHKIHIEVSEMSIRIDMNHMLLIRSLLDIWSTKAPEGDFAVSIENHFQASKRISEDTADLPPEKETTGSIASGFDEKEFFDAMENDSQSRVSDDISAWLDENWLSDSNSVLDIDSQSVTNSRRRRRRDRSVSEVSSLSEGSASRFGRSALFDTSYLSAENLAKLEEEGDDGSIDSGETSSGADSFHSAVSPKHAAAILDDLKEDIRKAEALARQLKMQLSAARRDRGEKSSAVERVKTLSIEYKRVQAELEGLQATRLDLEGQVPILERNGTARTPGDDSAKARASHSMRRASALLQMRRRPIDGRVHEHSMTKSLDRKIVEMSVFLQKASCTIDGLKRTKSTGSSSCEISISESKVAMFQSAGACRVYLDVEGVSLSLQHRRGNLTDEELLFVGGLDCSRKCGLLPETIPHFLCSPTAEEEFLECSMEIEQGAKDPFRTAKLRLSIGDFEMRPTIASIDILQRSFRRAREEEGTTRDYPAPKPATVVGRVQVPIFFDAACRLCSVRLLLSNNEGQFGAVVITEMGLRLAGSSSHRVFRDRTQIDLRCNNVQVVALSGPDRSYATELLGKKEVYGPLIRFRCRRQLVPATEAGGWVVYQTQESDGHLAYETSLSDTTAKSDFVWNLYATLKVESFASVLSPSWIRKCHQAFVSLRKVCRPSGPARRRQKARSGATSHPIRWRVDASQDNASLCLRESFTEQNSPAVVLRWTTVVLAQRSLQHEAGFSMDVSLDNASLMQMPDEWLILEPTAISLDADVATNNPICCTLEVPRLLPPEGWQSSFYKCDGGTHPQETESVFSFGDLVRLHVRTVKANLTGKICNLIKELCTSMASSFPKQRADGGTRPKPKDRSRGLTLAFDEILIIIGCEGSVQKLRSGTQRLFSFSLASPRVSFRENPSSRSLHAEVATARLTDTSWNPGAHVFEAPLRDSGGQPFFWMSSDVVLVGNRYRVSTKVRIESNQFVVLPSMIRSFLSFSKDLNSKETPTGLGHKTGKKVAKLHNIIEQIDTVEINVQSRRGQLVLSSKDVPKHARENASVSVGTVVVRWGILMDCTLRHLNLGDGVDSVVEGMGVGMEHTASTERLSTYLGSLDGQDFSLIAHSGSLRVQEFQVLRSAICLSPTTPHSFLQTPPSSGEHRITNSFSFSFEHRLRACFLPPRNNCGGFRMTVAHCIELTSDFVDVLAYIAQSEGGLNETLRTTIFPIIDILKRRNDDPPTSQQKKRSEIEEALVGATTVFSVRTDGLQMTCVPGGATRLTESPIIKFAVLGIEAGGASVPVKTEASALSKSSLEAMVASSGVQAKHLIAASWFECELSASYNNRRIVAWEPFVEPWGVKARVGADLMQIGNLSPLVLDTSTGGTKGKDDSSQPLDRRARLRDISRLFSSPFKLDKSASPDRTDHHSSIESDDDFCFFALSCSADGIVTNAFFPYLPSSSGNVTDILPHTEPSRWLALYGIPPAQSGDVNSLFRTKSFTCYIADSSTLNVNATGALIENLSHFVGGENSWDSTKLAPHRIRNDSGLTLRFREVLDSERVDRGEKPDTMLLTNGEEAPLSLRRSLSQSCDPHRAYISIELGSFEDTVDRIDQPPDLASQVSLFSAFAYKVGAKVPVDMVGIQQYPLESTIGSNSTDFAGNRSVGWVIVRVEVRNGIKMVTVESPVSFKNTSDNSLLCEVRDADGLSSVWRTVVPPQTRNGDSIVPVPADLAPLLHKSYGVSVVALDSTEFRHESEILATGAILTPITPPIPYSQSSFERGLIGKTHVSLKIIGLSKKEISSDLLHLNLCSLRVGSFAFDPTGKASSTAKLASLIPEQRMLVFRPSLVFRNQLAFSFILHVRKKSISGREVQDASPWIDLGVLQCGNDCSWSGALSSDLLEVRIKFCQPDGSELRQFPDWSSIVSIPSARERSQHASRDPYSAVSMSKLKVLDPGGVPLNISITSTQGSETLEDNSSLDSTRTFSSRLAAASRVICLHAPFWIVDGSGLDLEYRTKSPVAGQDVAGLKSIQKNKAAGVEQDTATLGLGELLEDRDLIYLPSRVSFRLLMVGDEGSSRLFVRQRCRIFARKGGHIPWSDSIPLSHSERSYYDTFIAPRRTVSSFLDDTGNEEKGPFALRSRILSAPDSLGGKFGTKLIHVVCQYAIVNELSREIEAMDSSPSVIPADGRPRPFHFNDSKPFRFRPKEFGWMWSGKIDVTKRRKEVTLSLKHKLKGLTVLTTLEFRYEKGGGTCTIILRPATHSPYRVENRSMFPLQYRLVSSNFGISCLTNMRGSVADTVILPFHDADFAWDEPDAGKRLLTLSVTDFGGNETTANSISLLGSYRIDRLSPGAELQIKDKLFRGMILADGPTRVIRIFEPDSEIEAALPANGQMSEVANAAAPNYSVSVNLAHGIGISIVDWTPKELLYLFLDEISMELTSSSGKESVSGAIGRVVANNQLWVTPYPVMLHMGSKSSRRRNRRHKAVSLSWRRSLSSQRELVLIDQVELSTEPSVISLDGNLVGLLLEMLRQFRELNSETDSVLRDVSRNTILRSILEVCQAKDTNGPLSEKADTVALELYSAVDYMATAALASKLRSHYRPPDEVIGRTRAARPYETLSDGETVSARKQERKYYIGKLWISTTKTDVSWSGPLPIVSLPRIMRPTLTFEGLPVLLRPFSIAHSYGEADEYLQTMKSHYVSIWRILDLLVGVVTKPTFVVRACIFTWRESIATALEMTANILQTSGSALSTVNAADSHSTTFFPLLSPLVTFNKKLLGGISRIALFTSTVLQYDASWYRARAGLVRSRNPRLFANVDGKDILVEYVEGENAGRAILSRVRQGIHLGEGYVFHVEGVFRLKENEQGFRKRDSMPLILMLTFDHIILLNGELKESFCAVVWEVSIKNIVFVEAREVVEGSQVAALWHLRSDVGLSKREDRFIIHARSAVGGSGGLGCMHCEYLLLPVVVVNSLLAKIRGLLDPHVMVP